MALRFGLPVGAGAVFIALASWSTVADAEPPFDPQPMQQFVNGVPVNQILAEENALTLYKALESYNVPPPSDPTAPAGLFGQWIVDIRRDADKDVLSGLGGIVARSFLAAAEHALSPVTGGLVGATVKITGQIPQQVELMSGFVEPGFYHNAVSQSCHLWVVMVTTVEQASGGPTTSEAFRWKVNVGGGHCKVAPRDDSNIFNVFPTSDTVSIPATVAGNRDHKLWARGTGIAVNLIQRDANYDPTSPSFVTLSPSDPNFGTLYQTDADSCIDMMFVGPPPATLSPGDTPPFYCLGRCEHPPIINTM